MLYCHCIFQDLTMEMMIRQARKGMSYIFLRTQINCFAPSSLTSLTSFGYTIIDQGNLLKFFSIYFLFFFIYANIKDFYCKIYEFVKHHQFSFLKTIIEIFFFFFYLFIMIFGTSKILNIFIAIDFIISNIISL